MKSSRWIIAAAVGVALVALFFVLKPTSPPEPTPTALPPTAVAPTSTAESPTEASPADRPDDVVAAFEVASGDAEGPRSVKVEAGQTVTLEVTSDVDGEIHVHGYEILQNVRAGQTKSVQFEADAPGRFEVAFHAHEGEEVALTELEVRP